MKKILALETSAKTASCAVCEGDRLLCESSVCNGLTHSQTLLPMTREMLRHAGIGMNEIEAVAVAHGPGSFTGLRIGISAAKGIAQALDIRCMGVSTLEGLAENWAGSHAILICVMDARREQVYYAAFEARGGVPKRLCEDMAISIEQLTERLEEKNFKLPMILVGDGAILCYNKMKDRLPVLLAPPHNRMQRAAGIGFCAARQGKEVLAAALTPQYLRLSQAERERIQKMERMSEV